MRRVIVEDVTGVSQIQRKKRIKLHPRSWFIERAIDLPSYIWQEAPFTFDPIAFVPSASNLDKAPFDESVQHESLARFEENPFKPLTYVVASEPNDGKALYFAAYLMQRYLETTNSPSTVTWERVYGGYSKRNYEVRNSEFLVLSNLSPVDTNNKLEYVRDVLDMHSEIPKIVVVSGEDPISFAAARLHIKLTHLFFYSANLVKRRIEVS